MIGAGRGMGSPSLSVSEGSERSENSDTLEDEFMLPWRKLRLFLLYKLLTKHKQKILENKFRRKVTEQTHTQYNQNSKV